MDDLHIKLIAILTIIAITFISNKIVNFRINEFERHYKFPPNINFELKSVFGVIFCVYMLYGILFSIVIVLTLELKGIIQIDYNRLLFFIG